MTEKTTPTRPATAGRVRRARTPIAAVPDLPAEQLPGRVEPAGTNRRTPARRPRAARKPPPTAAPEVDTARSAAGRSAYRRGHERTYAAVEYLRTHGWPLASVQRHNNSHDVYGMPVGVEVTIEPMSEIGHKVDQARGDAEALGHDYWFVWKYRKQSPDPGAWYAITDGRVILAMTAELEQLRAQAIDADSAYHRGYEAHRRATAQP